MKESDVEDYLVERVKELGGEVRKVKWIGRNGAPDRLVMLPFRDASPAVLARFAVAGPVQHLPATIWVELKAPGKKATFPADARERAQRREHERMRRMGQRVEVIDSFEGVDALLR